MAIYLIASINYEIRNAQNKFVDALIDVFSNTSIIIWTAFVVTAVFIINRIDSNLLELVNNFF